MAETGSEGRSTVAPAYVRPSRSRTAAPSAAPVRARVARASVTSLASSGLSGSVIFLLLGSSGRHPGDPDRTDPVAPAGRALRLEPQPERLDVRAADRHAAEVLGHEAADAVDLLVLDPEVEELAEVVDREPRGDAYAVPELLDLGLLLVVLVGDLPDDL